MGKMVNCVKLGKEAEGLDRAPLPGELGQRILNNVSKEGWKLWMQHQTILINENRLSLIDPKAREFLEAEMETFLFGGGSEVPEGFTPPTQ
ncbi:MAG TPA: oxidative damage protection protein [Gammaproteobacteria bacterium]|nr:oxidative damage protection protein [Gammaproteobacteria bacterium]